jgi:hypothetical protein
MSTKLKNVLNETCLPLVGACVRTGGNAGRDRGRGSGRHAPKRRSGRAAAAGGPPPERPHPGEGRSPAGGPPGAAADPYATRRPTADPDELRLPLLWPGPSLPVLTDHMRAERVRPRGADDDALGTALTTALLLSAVLATRVVSARRAREERPETIPLEPLRVRSGRHRLA